MTLSDWKTLSITQEFMGEFKRRQRTLTEELADSAGVDPRLDAYRAGVIAALKDLVDFQIEEDSID